MVAEETRPAPPRWRRLLRWPLRLVALGFALTLLYFAASEIGTRMTVNGGADPLDGEIDVYLVSNGIHVDVWVPATRPERDWAAWFGEALEVRRNGYVSFGWGDRSFYLETPTWSDLTVATALRSTLLPTASVMRVMPYWGRPKEHDDVHLLRVSAERYMALVELLEGSFATGDDGAPILVDHPGYNEHDRFFEARGSYHLFRTCNVWTNDAVVAMGKEAAAWAPFERSARFHLPRNRGREGGGGAPSAR